MNRTAPILVALAGMLAVSAGPVAAQAPAAPTLEIVSATWGQFADGKPVEGKTVDVTGALGRAVKEGRLRIEVENGPFGDPASGKGKALAVRYVLDGKTGAILVNEGDTLLLPAPVLAGKLAVTREIGRAHV